MKIVFFGSDDFAATHLEELLRFSDCEVVACVTQPDRPKGRGMNMILSPIKELALKHNLDVFQPDDVKDAGFIESLRKYAADVFVVIAYGRILPPSVLEIPARCALNVHGSLLPKYRGAAPINWAIINGETQTGLTIIRMNPKMDAGDIVSQSTVEILPEDTSVSLRAKMMLEGAQLLVSTLKNLDKQLDQAKAQDASEVTLAPKLDRELGRIDWHKPARDIFNLVRGLQPWPGAYTDYKGKKLKVLKTQVIDKISELQPGCVVSVDKEGVLVQTTDQCILIKEVHYENSKPMTAYEFSRGHQMDIGKDLN